MWTFGESPTPSMGEFLMGNKNGTEIREYLDIDLSNQPQLQFRSALSDNQRGKAKRGR